MKKIRTLIIAFLFLAPISMLTTSCFCDELLALCDLVAEALHAPEEITLGAVINLTADVFNSPDENDCTGTNIAGITTSLVEIFVDLNDGSGYQLLNSFSLDQDEIAPNAYDYILADYTPNQAGSYRFDFYTDDSFAVTERDENNNGLSNGRYIETPRIPVPENNKASAYVTVFPGPNGETHLPGEPVFLIK